MTNPSFSNNNPTGGAIHVQLHYDHLSGTAHAWSTVFDGVLPSRYPNREAAADAARTVIARIISKDDPKKPMRDIRIWLR
ncbi:hypothetical protein [Neorhizobium sp. T7_12]|uniref:hypothetical protein n=1 Tax=Neorhizobium sp. T7_12 TaxID=2093832 RepID=UPI00155EE35F|nr:hypothetical protein [Neorhizobium sp. T7_12]